MSTFHRLVDRLCIALGRQKHLLQSKQLGPALLAYIYGGDKWRDGPPVPMRERICEVFAVIAQAPTVVIAIQGALR